MGHNDQVEILDIMKKKAPVLSLGGTDSLQIMDPQTYETLDAKCEPEVLKTLVEGDEITYLDYKGIKVLGKRRNQ